MQDDTFWPGTLNDTMLWSLEKAYYTLGSPWDAEKAWGVNDTMLWSLEKAYYTLGSPWDAEKAWGIPQNCRLPNCQEKSGAKGKITNKLNKYSNFGGMLPEGFGCKDPIACHPEGMWGDTGKDTPNELLENAWHNGASLPEVS